MVGLHLEQRAKSQAAAHYDREAGEGCKVRRAMFYDVEGARRRLHQSRGLLNL